MDLLRHLSYFVAVAEELHFGRAADRLHMAQPPLSQRIRGLERALGVQLFVRTSRHVALTPAGRVLLEEARALLAQVDGLHDVMRQVRDGTLGELRAAVPPQAAPAVLAGILRAFRDASPNVRLDVSEASTAEQARALKRGRLDVGLLMHPVRDASLDTGPVVEKSLGVLVREDGPLAGGGEVDLGELDGTPLVLFPRQTAPHVFDELLATCRAYGFVPADVHEAPRPEFGLGLVMGGDAIALAEQPAAAGAGVSWRPLANRPLSLVLSTAWRADARSPSIEAYTKVAVEALCEHAGWTPRAGGRAVAALPFGPRPSSGPLS